MKSDFFELLKELDSIYPLFEAFGLVVVVPLCGEEEDAFWW
jgi:hypothetical protein